MRKNVLLAGLAVAALIPSLAMAQETCEQRSSNRTAGTVVGAGLGALLGSAVAGHGHKGAGAIVGGIGGAVVGNQVAKGDRDCTHAYGYYDNNGQWHANSVSRADASGYYDRQGQWVGGAPNGYYNSQGRWVASNVSASHAGYYDSDGHWIPASANGYYEANGQWVAGSTSGHWDNGRWVAGPTTGHYMADGRWMAGEAMGHRDSNGAWVADAEPGYYDTNGRWRAGQATGYYDTRGRWIGTAASVGAYSANAGYTTRTHTMDIDTRLTRIEDRIQEGRADGSLSKKEARRAMNTLSDIRNEENRHRRYGRLSDRDEAMLQQRLDTLSAQVRMDRTY